MDKVKVNLVMVIDYPAIILGDEGANAIVNFAQLSSKDEIAKYHIENVLLKDILQIAKNSNGRISAEATFSNIVEQVEPELPEPPEAFLETDPDMPWEPK